MGTNQMVYGGCAAAFLVALGSTLVLAQGQPTFADSQKANAQALRQYSWKSRTEIKLKGESKNVKVEQVRYDLNGKLQKTPIAGPPPTAPATAAAPEPGGRGGGRLKSKVVENKKEEFGEMMQGLGQLVASYGHLPPEKAQAFAANSTKGKGEGAMEGTAQIQGANVLVEGDSMTMWVDPASQMMRRVEIKTVYEGKPATLITEYKSVPNGPTYMAQAMLTYPEKNVELTVDNYEYALSPP